jgi:hypothetical protein
MNAPMLAILLANVASKYHFVLNALLYASAFAIET